MAKGSLNITNIDKDLGSKESRKKRGKNKTKDKQAAFPNLSQANSVNWITVPGIVHIPIGFFRSKWSELTAGVLTLETYCCHKNDLESFVFLLQKLSRNRPDMRSICS